MRQRSIILALLLCFILITGCQQQEQAASSKQNRQQVKIERVVDGDTLEIQLNGKKEKLRLIGIDTPELFP
ncbi:thermonuclease family protein [Paenibacillus sp. FSL H7-0331]|uniref:thermonuclease family protein n=1 Tax=Paenibacillus sp. FSL H7-0331 TaxID=1920421 RepID=UPI00096BF11B|nr:hypothetical protein [Paenibacillus sp. FSL H7-0331]OMF14522.1 hypothetical protein BK127_17525 [Paenibacillus sp. FSL H7-0331]